MTKAHSITDVAQAAGVSTTTVSHALSGKRAVSAGTRQRIYEAIDRLDYRPNLVAKSLRNQKTNSVALLVADIANPYYPAVARAVHDGLNSEGYVSIIGNTDGEPAAERTFLREMVSRGVDGIIMQPAALSVPDIRAIVGRAMPLVLIAHERGTLLADQNLLRPARPATYIWRSDAARTGGSGAWTMTVVARWTMSWQATNGAQGTIALQAASTTQVQVGEMAGRPRVRRLTGPGTRSATSGLQRPQPLYAGHQFDSTFESALELTGGHRRPSRGGNTTKLMTTGRW